MPSSEKELLELRARQMEADACGKRMLEKISKQMKNFPSCSVLWCRKEDGIPSSDGKLSLISVSYDRSIITPQISYERAKDLE